MNPYFPLSGLVRRTRLPRQRQTLQWGDVILLMSNHDRAYKQSSPGEQSKARSDSTDQQPTGHDGTWVLRPGGLLSRRSGIPPSSPRNAATPLSALPVCQSRQWLVFLG